MYDFDGKVALVTGAGGEKGLGREIALRLAREGVHLAITDVSSPLISSSMAGGWRGLESVCDEIQAIGSQSLALACDIGQSSEVDQMVAAVIARFGKIDILVNNAGMYRYMDLVDMSDEVWASHLLVNLTGAFYCLRSVARQMMKRNEGGRIINISSLNGKTPTGTSQAAYCTSKFGLIGLTQSAAMELARHNILINALCPGLIETDLHCEDFKIHAGQKNMSCAEVSRLKHDTVKAKIPLGRLGTAEDIAKMVAFLCSDEADFITGQAINVNGGIFTAH